MEMTGARALVSAVQKMGAKRLYGIIGTSNVAFVDALYDVRDSLRYISCRHEQVAASMADAEGRLEGRPGVVLVHSGPGALNTLISAGNAYKDSSPFMIITGAVKRRLEHSDGMLEIDHLKLFETVCKGTFRIDKAARVPDVFSAAYRASMSGARGPVLIEVPEDVWLEVGDVDLDAMELEADSAPPVDSGVVSRALDMLEGAGLPLILSGGGVAYSRSSGSLVTLAEALGVPVITTGNGRGTMPEAHSLSLGRVGFGGGNAVADKALEKADALLCLGAGISDMTTYEYTLPVGASEIIAVDISGRVAPQAPTMDMVACDVGEFLSAAVGSLEGRPPRESTAWDEALRETRATWEGMMRLALTAKSEKPPGALVIKAIAERAPDNTIVSVGAGMHLLYPMNFMPCNHPLSFLSTVNFGSMGFGFAASMAAKLAHPERTSLAVLGDGDFMMTMQDLETVAREGIGVKVFVLNDNQFRVLNVRQKLQFQGHIHGTVHGNPDFARVARDFGVAGYRLERVDEIDEVVEKALTEEGPVLVDVLIDPEDLPPMNIEANLRMSASQPAAA